MYFIRGSRLDWTKSFQNIHVSLTGYWGMLLIKNLLNSNAIIVLQNSIDLSHNVV